MAVLEAVQEGRKEVARALLDGGAPVDAAALQGGTPLFLAATENHLQLGHLLLEHGKRTSFS